MVQAFVTLVTSNDYVVAATVVAQSLRNTGTERKIVVLHTDGVSSENLEALGNIFDEVIGVEAINSYDFANLALLGRPELGITFTKLRVWTLTQFEKAVFLDADTVVLSNIDDLFERPELSAAPDVGWPDCFNSGVFVFQPSLTTFQNLITLARSAGSFDGGDQGLLNQYFSGWASTRECVLPFGYNMTCNASYGYRPAFQHYKPTIKVIHFAGVQKPWLISPGAHHGNEHISALYDAWWQVYHSLHPAARDSKPVTYQSLLASTRGHLAATTPFSSTHRLFPLTSTTPSQSWHSSPSTGSSAHDQYGRPLYYASGAVDDILRTINSHLHGSPVTTPTGEMIDALHSGFHLAKTNKSTDFAEDAADPDEIAAAIAAVERADARRARTTRELKSTTTTDEQVVFESQESTTAATTASPASTTSTTRETTD